MSDALTEALRRKFKTPREAVLALGLDADLLNINTKERTPIMATRFTRPRRFAYDEEAGSAELREMLDDKEINIGDLIAAAIEHAPDAGQEELYSSLRELGEDKRGPRSWARDRLERRSLRARDRRLGKDDPEPFEGRPRPGGGTVRPDFEGLDDRGYPIENFGRSDADRQIREAGGLDRRSRPAHDMAMDRGRGGPAVLRYITGG